MFEVKTDHGARLMRITLRGFWTAGTMAAYSKVVRDAMADLQRTGGCKSILINMVDFPIQSREIAEGHAENLRRVKERGGIRVALVMQSALSKLQTARVAADTGHLTFDTEADAVAWLSARRVPSMPATTTAG